MAYRVKKKKVEKSDQVEDPQLGDLIKWVTESEDTTWDSRELSEKCRSYYDSKQWTDAEVKKLGKQKQAATVSNRIKPKIDSLLGMENTNRTTCRVYPRTPKHDKGAAAATEAIRFVLQDNSFDTLRPAAFENMLIEGTGGIEILVKPQGKDYRIIMNHIPWDRLIYDPHCRTKGFSPKTCRYLGQVVWMDLDEALEKYPDAKDILETMIGVGSSTYDDKPRWMDTTRKRVKIVELYYAKGGEIWYACFTRGGYCEKPKISPYKNEEGETEWPYEFESLFVEMDGGRYGAVRQLLDMQDEINKRRSKALHLMSVRQVRWEKGAVEDINKARDELAKPDGVLETVPGMEFEVLKTGDMAAAQFQLLSEAKMEIDAVGANAALMGKTQNQDASGRALLAREQAGKTELAPVFDALKAWDLRIYRKVWCRIKQYWKGEKWVRVTDDEQNLRWVGLNKPVTKGEQILQQAQEQGMPPPQLQALQAQIQQDPSMKEVVDTHNDVAELDVDIIVADVPDPITAQIEDFQTLGEMVKSGFPIPPMAVIEASPLLNKDKILKMMKEQPQIPPQVQEQMKKMQEELQKTTQENVQLKAGAQVETMKIQQKASSDQQDLQFKSQVKSEELKQERENMMAEMALKREQAMLELQLKREIAAAEHQIESESMAHEKLMAEEKHKLEKEKFANEKKMQTEEQVKKEAAPLMENAMPKFLQSLDKMAESHSKSLEALVKSISQSQEKLVAQLSKSKTVTLEHIKRDGEGKLTGASATTH